MDRERGSFELSDVRHPPSSASGVTEWKGDIFLEDDQYAHDYMRHCAVQSPGVECSLSVYDVVSGNADLANGEGETKLVNRDLDVDGLIESENDESITIRIIFMSQRQLNLTSVGKLSSYYSIPCSFWASGGNGSFLSSTSIDEVFKVDSRDFFLEILTKSQYNNFFKWVRPVYFLKWRSHNPRVHLFCMGASAQVERRLRSILSNKGCNQVLKDPFLLYLTICSEWYQTNLKMFWHLQAEVSAIERGADKGVSEPDFHDVHDLAKHCIQSVEIADSAVNVLSLLQKEHERVIGDLGQRASVDRVRAGLEHELVLFMGVMSMYATLEKRLGNQINLMFNLVAQRDARVSARIGRATQYDSTAMKTLAILGLVFLPCTAISAIFSMPFFDHPGKKLEVFSDFWVFWTIALPITVMTVTVWYVWQKKVVPPLDMSSVPVATQVEKEPSRFYIRRPRV